MTISDEQVEKALVIFLGDNWSAQPEHAWQEDERRRDMRLTLEAALAVGEGRGWIDPKASLPKDCDDVLAVWWQGERCTAHLRDGVWWYRGNMGIVSANIPPVGWMPLPKAPTPPVGGGT